MELEFLSMLNRAKILRMLGSMFFGIEIIIAVINMFLLIFTPSPYNILSILFLVLLWVIISIESYIMQEVERRLDFEGGIQRYQSTGKITYELFQSIIKLLNREKYHVCRELDVDGNIKEWSIYRKDMDMEEYFSDENKAILTSEDGLLSLIFFVKGEENNAKSFKRNKKTNGKRTKTILD